ncbi:MAG: phosphatase PAP2 family protein [Actinobacteria bacterium]|jgi:membrane-associated phospholipid phosphatase|nr:phosphatase PAP2 family protein [Actinomycetota bacterium]NCV43282.1 phosphatase PAP2 family protein [Actinomycetota bacterium]NCV83853.1 phosphatase PAP2 family protein [Actinomycetota bacterium]NCV95220.1 phosphatase PAP2 family protein [Actinomycetota bacterium]NCW75971.1 phosphatase PAP2 family protein [Actinomycetota bacterium]
MAVALRWSAGLFIAFVLVTLDVIYEGLLWRIDQFVADIERPTLTGFNQFLILRLDDLGLRWITATILILAAALIGRRFNSWRPLNLSILSLIFLNLFVGAAKIGFGRCKAREDFEVCMFTDGMAYPSGHTANALVTWGLLAYIIFRYTHREPFEGLRLYWVVGLMTVGVCIASLIRNTHWFTDLLGGMFLGGAILVLVVAIDRFIPSEKQPS